MANNQQIKTTFYVTFVNLFCETKKNVKKLE